MAEDQQSGNSNNQFFLDLCKAMVAANIPSKTLNNKEWRDFLTKYCVDQHIPDESTIRRSYLDETHRDVVAKIKEEIDDNYYWISVDETTDRQGRMMANLIIGSLSEFSPGIPRLVASRELDKSNSDTVAQFVNNTLRSLWPNGNEDKMLLLLSDAGAYMIKAAKSLKVFYTNMKHVTCLAHGPHRVCEEIRKLFPNVNKLISSVKKIYVKAPTRIDIYKRLYPDLPLPPAPIITRWGTWVKAALFYAEHFDKIEEVII